MTYALSVAWLIALIVAPIAIYWFWIRPKATLGDAVAEHGVWSAIKRFRTYIVSFIGILITVLPDLLQMLAGIDYQQVLPAPWSIFAGPAVTIALLLVRASATTPPGEPPSKEA